MRKAVTMRYKILALLSSIAWFVTAVAKDSMPHWAYITGAILFGALTGLTIGMINEVNENEIR